MSQMNAAVDLNLVRVFLAVWDQRSLTAAGDRLGLTQPAVSHALRRLRDLFGDPLFVRSPGGMVPTEAATRLHAPLRQAFDTINRALHEHASFDPATTERAFRIAMSDVSEFYYLPPLLARLEQVAPFVRLETFQLPPGSIATALRTGEVDLALGYVPQLEEGCISHRLFGDRFICLVRAGHPAAGAPLTAERLAALRYVHADTNASGQQLIERCLAELGVKRRIAVRSAHLTIAPEIVRNTDLAALFPQSMAERINEAGAFALLELPFDLPEIEIAVHAHTHFASDMGTLWLRETISSMLRPGLGRQRARDTARTIAA
jgi:DNA-binding transcriptional LysR family regulator